MNLNYKYWSLSLVLGLFMGCQGLENSPKTPVVASTPKIAEKPTPPSPTIPTTPIVEAEPDIENYIEAKVMVRGYCMAGTSKADGNALGGYGSSSNLPQTNKGKPVNNAITLPIIIGNLVDVAGPNVCVVLNEHNFCSNQTNKIHVRNR